jgi:hypothetical protein
VSAQHCAQQDPAGSPSCAQPVAQWSPAHTERFAQWCSVNDGSWPRPSLPSLLSLSPTVEARAPSEEPSSSPSVSAPECQSQCRGPSSLPKCIPSVSERPERSLSSFPSAAECRRVCPVPLCTGPSAGPSGVLSASPSDEQCCPVKDPVTLLCLVHRPAVCPVLSQCWSQAPPPEPSSGPSVSPSTGPSATHERCSQPPSSQCWPEQAPASRLAAPPSDVKPALRGPSTDPMPRLVLAQLLPSAPPSKSAPALRRARFLPLLPVLRPHSVPSLDTDRLAQWCSVNDAQRLQQPFPAPPRVLSPTVEGETVPVKNPAHRPV